MIEEHPTDPIESIVYDAAAWREEYGNEDFATARAEIRTTLGVDHALLAIDRRDRYNVVCSCGAHATSRELFDALGSLARHAPMHIPQTGVRYGD